MPFQFHNSVFLRCLLFWIAISINYICHGSIFFVSPNGDDLSGTGSANNPWRSLHKACEEVKSIGDTIFIKAGIYDEVRTSRLARGVSLIGEGSESIITSTTLSREWTPILDLRSDILENGNQTISYLRFDGSSTTAAQALWIAKRHNVAIHDCIFTDFKYTAVLWVGDGGNSGSDPYDKAVYPQHYVTGSRFYNNTVTNCSLYSDYGRGALFIGGHEGMVIHNNTISQTERPDGQNGFPVKAFANGGFMRGLRIFDNIITKTDAITWGFAIEGAFFEGCEIFNNKITGAVDINFIKKGGYDYGLYIHNNILGPDSISSVPYSGVILEFGVEDVIIERNLIRNCAVGIHHTMRYPEPWIKRVKVRYNEFSNLGSHGNYHSALRFGENQNNYIIEDYEIDNNTFHGNPKTRPYFGLHMRGFETASDIKVRNNIFMNFSWSWFESNRGNYFHNLTIQNNILYKNGNSNSASLNGKPDNMIFSENMKVNPEICSDYNLRLKPGSKGIKAGIHIPDQRSDMDGIEPGNPPNVGCYESIAVDECANHENKTGPRFAIVASIFLFSAYIIFQLFKTRKRN